MRAARTFAEGLRTDELVAQVAKVRVELFGSLGVTGKGHGSDKAVMLGLEGELPESTDTDAVDERLRGIRESLQLTLLGEHAITFD